MTLPHIAVITGGGTGIGAAVAHTLAESCSVIVLVGRRQDRLDAMASELTSKHPGITIHGQSVDLTNIDSVNTFIEWAHQELPQVNVVVNNAGAAQPQIEEGLTSVASAWESTWRANTLSSVLVTEGLKDLLARPGGRIIMIGSFAAELGTGSPAYASAKGALAAYAISLMRELGSQGITANVVAPGFTDGTELLAGRISPERRERLLTSISARRPGTPEEIASLVGYLASPLAGFINGELITANGGTYLSG
jgi:3-oxoacyl-[acyl-carrier protein] reductase